MISNNVPGKLYGLTIIYNLNRIFSIKADIDIEEKGWKLTNYNISTDINQPEYQDITQVLNYFDIPAFMHIWF